MAFLKTLEKKYDSFVDISAAAVLVTVLFVTFFFIVKSVFNTWDEDASLVYIHAKEIWDNGSLYVPEWRYLTLGEFDSVMFFAIFFYGLTGDLMLSFKISGIIFILLFVWTVFRINNGRFSRCFSMALILVPWGIGGLDYFNMVFLYAAPYSFKVLVPLMLISVILSSRDRFKKTDIPFALLTFLMMLLLAMSSGLYTFGCALIGIIAFYFLYFYQHKQLPDKSFYIIALLTIAVTGLGLFLLKLYDADPHASEFHIKSAKELAGIPANIIQHMCMLVRLDLYGSPNIFSTYGIYCLCRIVFVVFLIITAIVFSCRFFKARIDLRQTMLLSVFATNTILVELSTFSGSLSRTRYFLIGFVALFILLGDLAYEAISHKNLFIYRLGTFLAIMGLYGVIYISSIPALRYYTSDDSPLLPRIREIAIEAGVDVVYFPNQQELAEVLRLLMVDDGINSFNIHHESHKISVRDYYHPYDLMPVFKENCLVVVKNEDEFAPVIAEDVFGDDMEWIETLEVERENIVHSRNKDEGSTFSVYRVGRKP